MKVAYIYIYVCADVNETASLLAALLVKKAWLTQDCVCLRLNKYT